MSCSGRSTELVSGYRRLLRAIPGLPLLVGGAWSCDDPGPHGSSPKHPEETSSAEVPVPQAPKIVDLGRSARTLTLGETVTLTAVVLDPDGSGDILGGELRDLESGLPVARFEPTYSDRFEAQVSWADLHAVHPIDFQGQKMRRELEAVFVDRAEEAVRARTTLDLMCFGIQPASCQGVCVDLDNAREHCGRCRQACPVAWRPNGVVVGGCEAGACTPTYGGCFSTGTFPDCASACAAEGRTCRPAACQGATALGFSGPCAHEAIEAGQSQASCQTPLPWPTARCCCG